MTNIRCVCFEENYNTDETNSHTRQRTVGGGNVKIKVFPAKKQNKKKTPKPPPHPSTHAHKNKSSCAMTHSKSRKKNNHVFFALFSICSAQWVTSGARACLCTCTWACTRMCCFCLSVCGLKPRCPCNVIALQLAVPQRCVA